MRLLSILLLAFSTFAGSSAYGQFISRASLTDSSNIGGRLAVLGSFVYYFASDMNQGNWLITYELVAGSPDQIVERHRIALSTGFAAAVRAVPGPQPYLLVVRHAYSSLGGGNWGNLEVWGLQNPALPTLIGQSATLRHRMSTVPIRTRGTDVYYGHQDAYYHLDISNPASPVIVDSAIFYPNNPLDFGIQGMDVHTQGFFYTHNAKLYAAQWQAGGSWVKVDSLAGYFHAVWSDPLRARIYCSENFAFSTEHRAFDIDANGHLQPIYHASANPFWPREVGGAGNVMIGLRDTDVPVLLKAYTLADTEWVFLDDEPGMFGGSDLSVDGFTVIEWNTSGMHGLHWLSLAGAPMHAGTKPNSSVRGWPNPADASLHVASDFEMQAVAVIDQMGRRRLELPLNGAHDHTLPLEALPSGLYWVEVRLASGGLECLPLLVRH